MEANINILNNDTSKTAEQSGVKPGNVLSIYNCANGTVKYVGEEWFLTVISENNDIPNICQTPYKQLYEPNDDTDKVLVRGQIVGEKHPNVAFSYDVPGIEPESTALAELANLYQPWDSLMALFQTENQGPSSL